MSIISALDLPSAPPRALAPASQPASRDSANSFDEELAQADMREASSSEKPEDASSDEIAPSGAENDTTSDDDLAADPIVIPMHDAPVLPVAALAEPKAEAESDSSSDATTTASQPNFPNIPVNNVANGDDVALDIEASLDGADASPDARAGVKRAGIPMHDARDFAMDAKSVQAHSEQDLRELSIEDLQKLDQISADSAQTIDTEVSLHLRAVQQIEGAVPARQGMVPPPPHAIARLIADKVSASTDNRVEITLTPEELGKVTIILFPGDKPSVAVYADNASTLDLLRRNAELLSRELRAAGMADAQMTFGDDGARDSRAGNDWRDQSRTIGAGSGTSGPHASVNRPPSKPPSSKLIDLRM